MVVKEPYKPEKAIAGLRGQIKSSKTKIKKFTEKHNEFIAAWKAEIKALQLRKE